MITLSGIVGLVGGISVVATGLIAFLGRSWMLRLIESERGSAQAQMDFLRAELQSMNQRLQAVTEKPTFMNKPELEKAYERHGEVFEKLIELRYAATRLRPVLDQADPSETDGDCARMRLHDFREAAQAYREVFEKNRLLYAGTAYAALFRVMDKCQTESVEYLCRDRGWKEYWGNIRQNLRGILDAIENSRTAISTRLYRPVAHIQDFRARSRENRDQLS
jgi:hypothetical protein